MTDPETSMSTDSQRVVGVGAAPTATARERCEGCGNLVDRFGGTAFEAYLCERNHALRSKIREIEIMPLPDSDHPGYQVWSALMNDLRDEGRAQWEVRHTSQISIDWSVA